MDSLDLPGHIHHLREGNGELYLGIIGKSALISADSVEIRHMITRTMIIIHGNILASG